MLRVESKRCKNSVQAASASGLKVETWSYRLRVESKGWKRMQKKNALKLRQRVPQCLVSIMIRDLMIFQHQTTRERERCMMRAGQGCVYTSVPLLKELCLWVWYLWWGSALSILSPFTSMGPHHHRPFRTPCVCVCVCVCERERDRKREREKERERERERKTGGGGEGREGGRQGGREASQQYLEVLTRATYTHTHLHTQNTDANSKMYSERGGGKRKKDTHEGLWCHNRPTIEP